MPIRKIVLRTLYASGILAAALVAPKALTLFSYFNRHKIKKHAFERRISQAIGRLERDGFIEYADSPGPPLLRLTNRGESLAERVAAATYRIPEPAFWDGKWRVVLFDVREKRRRTREQLRLLLSSTGFVRLQDSVWIYPYPCDEFLVLIRAHLASGVGEVRYLTAEHLESDRKYRERFGLT